MSMLVASAVRACPGVSDLAGGRFGDATSYLPGRRVTGVAVRGDAVRISVRAKWGVSASDLLEQITIGPRTSPADRRIDVVIAEIDDPPWLAGQEPIALPAGSDASRPGRCTPPRRKRTRLLALVIYPLLRVQPRSSPHSREPDMGM